MRTPVLAMILLLSVATQAVAGGPVILDGGDRDDHPPAGITFITEAVEYIYNTSTVGTGILIIGASGTALTSAQQAIAAAGLPAPTVVTGAAISTVNFSQFRMIYVPSSAIGGTSGGITDADVALLAARKTEIQSYVNAGGGVFALTAAGSTMPYAYLAIPQPFTILDCGGGGCTPDVLSQTPELAAIGFNISNADLNAGKPTHNRFTGPAGFNGLKVLVVDDAGRAVTIGGLANIGASLSISKTASPNPASAGSNLTYTFTFANNGTDVANGIVATETLPSGLSFVSADPRCSNNNNVVTCSLGTLAAGGSGTFTITALVSQAATGTITNNNYSISGTGIPSNTGTVLITPVDAAAAAIPTLSEWGLMVAALGLLAMGLRFR